MHSIGTLASIHQVIQAQDGALRIIVYGLERIRLRSLVSTEPFLLARTEGAPEIEEDGIEGEGLVRAAKELFAES